MKGVILIVTGKPNPWKTTGAAHLSPRRAAGQQQSFTTEKAAVYIHFVSDDMPTTRPTALDFGWAKRRRLFGRRHLPRAGRDEKEREVNHFGMD